VDKNGLKKVCIDDFAFKKRYTYGTIIIDYEEILRKYPILGQIYELLRKFHELVFSKKVDLLDEWMAQAEKLDISEISSYVSGLKNDLEAVRNAITLEFNNGLAEGSINKLKVIKRIIYGRNSFELLKSKLLRLELQKSTKVGKNLLSAYHGSIIFFYTLICLRISKIHILNLPETGQCLF